MQGPASGEPESLSIILDRTKKQVEVEKPQNITKMSVSTHIYNKQLMDHLKCLRRAIDEEYDASWDLVGKADCT